MAQRTRTETAILVGGAVLGAATFAWLTWLRPKSGVKRIALIGDSLAVGLTSPMKALAQQASVPFQAEGRGGTTVAQWLANPTWGSWVAGFAPSVTLIVLGTNDYANPSPNLAQYKQLAAKFPNSTWVMPPDAPFSPMTKVRAIISQVGVPVIPEATGLTYAADGVHPSPYGPFAAFIWSYL